jgi:hypothetical protein
MMLDLLVNSKTYIGLPKIMSNNTHNKTMFIEKIFMSLSIYRYKNKVRQEISNN